MRIGTKDEVNYTLTEVNLSVEYISFYFFLTKRVCTKGVVKM